MKSNKLRGTELYNKLIELSNNGELDKCTCRYDIVKLLGYNPHNEPSGHVWISNKIRKGYLIETISKDGSYCKYKLKEKNNPYYRTRKIGRPAKETKENHGMSKETLDQLMIEYDWKKNTLEDNLYFLTFMTELYSKIDVKGD